MRSVDVNERIPYDIQAGDGEAGGDRPADGEAVGGKKGLPPAHEEKTEFHDSELDVAKMTDEDLFIVRAG